MFLCALSTAALLLAALYWYLTKTYNYWKNQNVPSAPNPVPGFGHMLPVLTLKESIAGLVEKMYAQTDSSAIGFYFLRTPAIVVRDPEIAKSVMQTNFSSFRTNLAVLDEENDPVLTKNPFLSDDSHAWQALRMRSGKHLTGRKMRVLHRFVDSASSETKVFVDRKIKENNGESYECLLKSVFERYTGEFVANSAFGIQGESFEDNPSAKAFTRVAKQLREPSFFNGLKQAFLFYMPSVAKVLKLSFVDQSVDNYFRNTLNYIINERKQKDIVVEDFLQICLDETADEEFNNFIADIIIFSMDSYEGPSLTLSSLFYLLSNNIEVQDKLRKHLQAVVSKYNGEITYEALKDMTYLDQVMYESMRMIPAAGVLQKMCTEEIKLKGSDGLTYHLKPGHAVMIPNAALQVDSRFWPEPQVFNPDRFSPEQSKHNRFAFLPFGEGPRMCVGMRLGQMLVKQATAALVLNFSVEKSSITKEPLERDPNALLSYYKGGLWAKFKKIA